MKKSKATVTDITQTVTAALSTNPAHQRSASNGSLREPSKLSPEKLTAAIDNLFADFDTKGDPELIKALKEAKQFCRDMASGNKAAHWLTLLGRSGTGKTMLAKKIAIFFARHLDFLPDERNRRGEVWTRRGGFKPWVDIVGDMLTGDFSGFTQLKNDWLVVIDDIGVENPNIRALALSKLYEVLNARLGQWTVITANLDYDAIGEKLDQRIASRLIRDNSILVNVDTVDFNDRD